MKRKVVLSRLAGSWPITVTQTGVDSFTVAYGEQVKRRLTYAEAATEYGRCVFHCAVCDGEIIGD